MQVTTQHAPGTAAEIRSPVTNLCLHVDSSSDNPEVGSAFLIIILSIFFEAVNEISRILRTKH